MPGSPEPVGLPGSYPEAGELRMARDVMQRFAALSSAGLPNEACGILAGPVPAEGEAASITAVFPLTNVAASPERYETDPLEQLEAYNAIAESGLSAVGIFHSHPETVARPSMSDIAEAYDPAAVYLIVSLAEPRTTIRAFHIEDAEVSEHPIVVTESIAERNDETKGTNS